MTTNDRPNRLALGVIRGDGIGPELIESALAVLDVVAAAENIGVELHEWNGGAAHYHKTGEPLESGALDQMRSCDGVLKGPVGLPGVRRPDGTEGGLLGGVMRGGLDTYANVRPIRLLCGAGGATRHAPGQIDYVIVRENTEGLYLSRGSGVATPNAAADQLLVTRVGVERVVRRAFRLARSRSGAPTDGTHRVTCVDKSNVLRSYALFRAVFDEVALEYPEIETDHLYADAAAHELVVRPEYFDVLVMENFLGDILSDLGAGTAGGLGMCGSGNIGDAAAYFEPIHGSAPDIAGRDVANPTSQILSAAMLLAHAGFAGAGRRVEAAVEQSFADGAIRLSSGGAVTDGTRAATRAVVERI